MKIIFTDSIDNKINKGLLIIYTVYLWRYIDINCKNNRQKTFLRVPNLNTVSKYQDIYKHFINYSASN